MVLKKLTLKSHAKTAVTVQFSLIFFLTVMSAFRIRYSIPKSNEITERAARPTSKATLGGVCAARGDLYVGIKGCFANVFS